MYKSSETHCVSHKLQTHNETTQRGVFVRPQRVRTKHRQMQGIWASKALRFTIRQNRILGLCLFVLWSSKASPTELHTHTIHLGVHIDFSYCMSADRLTTGTESGRVDGWYSADSKL